MKIRWAVVVLCAGLCVGCDSRPVKDIQPVGVPSADAEPLCREAIEVTRKRADALAKVTDRESALKYLAPEEETSLRMDAFAKRWRAFKERATEADKAVVQMYDAEYRVQQRRVDAEMTRIHKLIDDLQKRYGTR
jgi:hypothetical protein